MSLNTTLNEYVKQFYCIDSGCSIQNVKYNFHSIHRAEIEATACQTDTSNNIIFKALFLTGVFFTIMPGCISFYIEQIGPKRMLCKYSNAYQKQKSILKKNYILF